jgi:hypothetical protein
MHSLADLSLIVPSFDTQRIQEVQILLIHLLCELVETHLTKEQATHTSGTTRHIAYLSELEKSVAVTVRNV